MTRASLADDAFAASDDRALVVAGRDGRLRHAGTVARQLLLTALLQPSCYAADCDRLHEPIPEIAQMCSNLRATARGQIDQPPPVLRRRNAWGEFVLRASWLGPTDGEEPTRQIGITIERRVPRALAILRRIEELPLTAREKQLCLLLARDPDRHDLADAMGVGAGTVVTHQRSIYAKLRVHSRAKLIERLQPT
jgi:DNA-binding CsgD family transcriptional regulator